VEDVDGLPGPAQGRIGIGQAQPGKHNDVEVGELVPGERALAERRRVGAKGKAGLHEPVGDFVTAATAVRPGEEHRGSPRLGWRKDNAAEQSR
jgi:hypothetical protein